MGEDVWHTTKYNGGSVILHGKTKWRYDGNSDEGAEGGGVEGGP